MCAWRLKPFGTTSSTPRRPSGSSAAHPWVSSATSSRSAASPSTPGPRKVAAVAEWAPPASCTDVLRFVGLANYYRKFLRHFSTIATPLTTLCGPRARFTWADTEQKSFDALKAALTSAPVLRVWDPARPTRRLTDASELAISVILEQPDDAGQFHPVAFESRKLTSPDRKSTRLNSSHITRSRMPSSA